RRAAMCLPARVRVPLTSGLQAFVHRPSTQPEHFGFTCRDRGGGNAIIEPIRIAGSARRLRTLSEGDGENNRLPLSTPTEYSRLPRVWRWRVDQLTVRLRSPQGSRPKAGMPRGVFGLTGCRE